MHTEYKFLSKQMYKLLSSCSLTHSQQSRRRKTHATEWAFGFPLELKMLSPYSVAFANSLQLSMSKHPPVGVSK